MASDIPSHLSPAAQDAIKAIQQTLDEARALREATASADDPSHSSDIATLLREAAACYDNNDIAHGRRCLIRAVEYAQALHRKGVLKVVPVGDPGRAPRAVLADKMLHAMRIAHEPMLDALDTHYATNAFLDTFNDK